MRKCVLCHMRTTKVQISLRIRTVWSAPLLFAANTSSLYIWNFKILPGLCSWACQFVSCLIGDFRRHIFSWRGSFKRSFVSDFVWGRALWPTFSPLLELGKRGLGFETYLRRVVSLSKTLYSLKVLVNYPGSGGSRPDMTEKLLTGTLSLNTNKQTNKFTSKSYYDPSLIISGVSSEFVSSNIPSWQILTAHAQQFRGARDLGFCLKVPLDSLLVWASSGGSGETAGMRRLAWTFAARIGDKYQIHLTWPIRLSWGEKVVKIYPVVVLEFNVNQWSVFHFFFVFNIISTAILSLLLIHVGQLTGYWWKFVHLDPAKEQCK